MLDRPGRRAEGGQARPNSGPMPMLSCAVTLQQDGPGSLTLTVLSFLEQPSDRRIAAAVRQFAAQVHAGANRSVMHRSRAPLASIRRRHLVSTRLATGGGRSDLRARRERILPRPVTHASVVRVRTAPPVRRARLAGVCLLHDRPMLGVAQARPRRTVPLGGEGNARCSAADPAEVKHVPVRELA